MKSLWTASDPVSNICWNMTDVHSWFALISQVSSLFGLINQVSYAFSIAEKTLLFHQLLKPTSISFHWNDNHGNLFEESKLVIVVGIAKGLLFDELRPSCLAFD